MTQGFTNPFATPDLAVIQAACSDETTALTTGAAKITFRVPHAMTVTEVRGSLTTAQASGSTFTVDINQNGQSILSTKLTIDNTELTSTTAAAPPVIIVPDLVDDGEITVDIDQIGNGTAKGLKVTLVGSWQYGSVNTLNDGIVEFWPLNEASGNALGVVSGNDLTDNGSVGQAAGIGGTGNSRSFDGSTQWFDHATNADLEFGNVDWTLLIWVYTTDLTADRTSIEKPAEARVMFRNTGDLLRGDAADAAGPTFWGLTASTFGAISASTWYLQAVWYDSTAQTISISVNAGTVDSASLAAEEPLNSPTANAFYLGQSGSSSEFWQGRLQYAAKYARVLTQTEITNYYNSGSGKAWPFA